MIHNKKHDIEASHLIKRNQIFLGKVDEQQATTQNINIIWFDEQESFIHCDNLMAEKLKSFKT